MPEANRPPLLAIFDHDGILVDSLPFHEEAWYELGRRTGLEFPPEFIRRTFGMTNAMIMRELLGAEEAEANPGRVQQLGDMKEECYRAVASGKLELMAGVREVLDALTAAGARLAIGSSGPIKNLELTVTSTGLDGRFAAIASVEDIRHGKPDPEVFLVAARKAGGDPRRSVVFEDAPVGVQAAKAAGMLAVGVGTTHGLDGLRAAGADVLVESLEGFDVTGLINRMNAI